MTDGNPTYTQRFASLVAGSRFEDAPSKVQRDVRLLLLDGLACGIVGAQQPWAGRAVAALARDVNVGEGAQLWTYSRQIEPATAALLNGAFVQGSELDDYNEFSPVHASSVVVPSALASCPPGTSLGTLFDALLAGYEVAARVGLAMDGAAVVADGWHSGGVFGPLAAAAAAGRAMGLDEERMEHAIGMAATQASGLMAAQYRGDVKRLHHGFAARNGYVAAMLAAHRIDGILGVFEHEYGGYASTFLGDVDRAHLPRLTADFGSSWQLCSIGVKYHACMIGLHSIIDGLLDLKREHGFVASDVASVEIGLSRSVHRRVAFELPDKPSELGAQMNAAYVAAVALIDAQVWLDQFREPRRTASDVSGLRRRVSVHHDPRIDARGPTARMSSELIVILQDGRRLELSAPAPSVRTPDLDEGRIVEKVGTLASPTLGKNQVRKLLEITLNGSVTTGADELEVLVA